MPPKRGGATLTGGAAKNKKSSAFGPVIRLVKNPSSLIGKCVSNVPGSWWPNTTGPNKSKLYKIMVMAVMENGDMSKTIFKLGLCTDEDPDLTRSNLVEDVDYWLIEHKVLSP